MPQEYVVQSGDSLWSIAKSNGLTLADLQAANQALESRLPPWGINPGDKLTIPTSTTVPAATGAALGAAYMKAPNPPPMLPPPKARQSAKAAAIRPEARNGASLGAKAAAPSTGGNPTYLDFTVTKGDNLWQIAHDHNVTLEELKAANPQLADRIPPYGINPGDKIKIPSKLPPISKIDSPKAITKPCAICVLKSLEMECKHKRKVTPVGASPVQSRILEVIASITPNKEIVTLTASGQCDNGRKDCPAVYVAGPGLLTGAKKNLSVPITLPDAGGWMESYEYFFTHILMPHESPTVYQVWQTTCCGGPLMVAAIFAYPNITWKGEVSVGFSHDTHKDSNFNANKGYSKLLVHGGWSFQASISVTCDVRTWTLKGGTEDKSIHKNDSPFHANLFKGIQGFLDKISPAFSSMLPGQKTSAYGKVSIVWPNVKLGGALNTKELPKSWKVVNEGNVYLALDPLIGFEISADILNWLIIWYGGPLGKYLVKIKEKLAAGVGNDSVKVKGEIAIEFKVGGRIDGRLDWKCNSEGWEASGEVAITVPCQIEGRVSVEIKVFIFKAGAGAKLGAKTAFGARLKAAKSNQGAVVAGQFFFSGLTVYYSYYGEIGGAKVVSGAPKSKNSGSLKDEYSEKVEVIPAAAWPSSPTEFSLGKV